MPVQDWFQHQADVVRWKADQQARLFRVQSQVHDLENQIRIQKTALADRAILLFNQSQLTESELVKICTAISELKDRIEQKQAEQETINQERPPQAVDSGINVVLPASGLKCPVDGQLLAGRFCPEHGLEGIPVDAPAPPAPGANAGSSGAQTGATNLICPKCGRTLAGRFCPEHGVEGVRAG